MIATVVQNTTENMLPNILVKYRNNILTVVVSILVGDYIGRFHVTRIKITS